MATPASALEVGLHKAGGDATPQGRNHLIESEFKANFYEKFSEHVLTSTEALASEDVDKLALLSIICHDLKLHGVAYQQKFFRLLQHPNALGTEIHRTPRCHNSRQPNSPEFKSRPRYSRSRPPSSTSYKFTWPSKTKPKETYISIPMRYWSEEHKEESIVLCCILYLLLADVAPAFSTFRPLEPAGQEAGHNVQVDCPCLLAYFSLSPKGNKGNLKALLSEFVAMLQICFKENFFFSSGESGNELQHLFELCDLCEPCESSSSCDHQEESGSLDADPGQICDSQVFEKSNSDDFHIIIRETRTPTTPTTSTTPTSELGIESTRRFSVKTHNHIEKHSWFYQDSKNKNEDKSFVNPPRQDKKGRRPSGPGQRRKHSPSENNILVLNCHCEKCRSNATVQLEHAENSDEECPRTEAKRIVHDIYDDREERHYVTSVWRLFQLRYALQGFNHRNFRGPTADRVDSYFCKKVTELFKSAVTLLFGPNGCSEDTEKACLRLDFGERS